LEKREAVLKAKRDELAAEEKRLKAQLSTITAREAVAIRKRDTRRKILLGGELIAAAKAGDQTALDLIRRFVVKQDKPHNRKAFEGWQP
jgi:hypothetical protein